MNILLTGATGFLGSHLLEALLNHGYNVVILKRSTSNLWRIQHLINQVKSYNVDNQPIEAAFAEQHIDIVIHTACHYGRNSDTMSTIVETNLMFGLRILDACLKFNTDTFFNTDTLLQKYLNIYTLSKKQFVEWLKQQSDKIQVINLKLEHIYGTKDDINKFVPWVLSQLQQNVPEIKLTKGEQQRDFIYIDDVISAYLVALDNLSKLGSFNEFDVGTGNLLTIKTFITQLKGVYEKQNGVVQTYLNFGALSYRSGEMMSVEVNNHALQQLGWAPKISIQQGLLNVIKA
jgi:CDP-paratose synthetase